MHHIFETTTVFGRLISVDKRQMHSFLTFDFRKCFEAADRNKRKTKDRKKRKKRNCTRCSNSLKIVV